MNSTSNRSNKKIQSLFMFGLSLFSLCLISCNKKPVEPVSETPIVEPDPKPVIDYAKHNNYYKETEGLTGTLLQYKLYDINQPKNPSYDWSRYEAADESPNDSTCVISLYTRHDIKKNAHVSSSYSWTLWNREHIFVKSQFSSASTDNHNIFACEGKINQIRDNMPFAEVSHADQYRVTIENHVTNCYTDNIHFEPCDEAKGEVARALLYGAVTYNFDIERMISLETALRWHKDFPVTERETKRNETIYKLQKNRNPFVDFPEFAEMIFTA